MCFRDIKMEKANTVTGFASLCVYVHACVCVHACPHLQAHLYCDQHTAFGHKRSVVKIIFKGGL